MVVGAEFEERSTSLCLIEIVVKSTVLKAFAHDRVEAPILSAPATAAAHGRRRPEHAQPAETSHRCQFCGKVRTGSTAMAKKTTATTTPRRRSQARKAQSFTARRSARTVARPHWKQVLERNLIREGYSPDEAKELVALSAA